MNDQMTFTTITGEQYILPEEVEKKEKAATEYSKARNRARSILKDAKLRYIKEKTRARSKKAAEERDEILKSPRFKALEIYDRFEDIQESYGWDWISEAERDRLEALWEEREKIRKQTDNGIYSDLVTEALDKASSFIFDLWQDEIDEGEDLRRKFDKQQKEINEEVEAWMKRQEESMRRATE